jgi:hypothetical protein
MSGNDVRVRLSPEGVREVQNALRRVQRESDKISRQSTTGITRLSGAIGGLRRGIASLGLGATVSIAGLSALGRQSLRTADQIAKAANTADVSTDQIQELRFAFGQLAGTTDQGVDDSLRRFNRRLGLARTGAGPAVQTFRRLGIELQNADGSLRSTEELLEVTLQRLAEIPDPALRAAEASQVFGEDLGPKLAAALNGGIAGMQRLRGVLRAEGGVIPEEQLRRAEEFNDQIDLLQRTLTAQYAQTVLDNARALQQLAQALGTVASVAVSGIGVVVDFTRVLGEELAARINGIAADDVPRLTRALREAESELDRLRRLQEAFPRDPSYRANFERQEAIVARLRERLAIGRRLTEQARQEEREQAAAGADAAGGEIIPVDPGAAERRRLQQLRQTLEAEQVVRQAALSAQTTAEERRFEQGLISLEEYTERRQALLRQAAAAEVRILEAQLAEVQQSVDITPEDRAGQEANLQAQIQARQIQLQQELEAVAAGRLDAERRASQELLQTQQQLLEAEGRREESALVALELQKRALTETLRGAGAGTAEIEAAVARLDAATRRQLNFERITTEAQRALETLSQARQRIEQDVQVGITTTLGGQQRILQLERARLPVLQQLARAAQEAAAATGDPELVAQAEQLALAVGQIGVSVAQASNSFARFRDQAEQGALQSLTDFFTTGIQQAESFADAFRELARSVIDSLQRIAAEALATQIITGLGGFFGGGANAAGGSVAASGGGLVRGPGTGTSDSINARVSDGEYIVRAAAVRQRGVLGLLQRINSMPRYAAGGLVGPVPRFAAGGLVEAGSGSNFRGRLEVGLADGLEPRGSPTASEDFIVDVIRRRPREIGNLIR